MPTQISTDIIGKAERVLVYGDPGVGKTHFALTAPTPIYYICTGGPAEVQTFYSKRFQDKYGKRIKESDLLIDSVDLMFSWKNGDASGFDQIKELIEKAIIAEQKGEIAFNTIVIDNITTLTELQIEKAIKLANLNKPASATGKSTEQKFDETGVLQVADHEWKDVQNMMQKFLSELFNLNKNFVVIAHEWEQVVTDRATKVASVTAVKPLFIGKQRDLIANLFSNVWRMYSSGQVSAIRTVGKDSNPSIIAKTRIGGILSDDYLDPDMTKIIGLFKTHAEKMSQK